MLLRLRYEARRRRLLKQAPEGSLRDYLNTPWPALAIDIFSVPLLALDLETSGLNPRKDDIVSMGWVLIDNNRVKLSSARHLLVKPRCPLSDTSVKIHGIGDDRAAGGKSMKEALSLLLEALSGRVLIGHHICMDAAFLATACRGINGANFAVPCVDTLALLVKNARRRQLVIAPGSLTLSAARAAKGLPPYPAHNALCDALAAAELWLALNADYPCSGPKIPLRSVVTLQP